MKVKCSSYRHGVAHRVGRGIALLFNDRCTRREWVVSSTPRLHFTPGKDPVPVLQEAGWAPGPVWTGGKSRPHRDLIPDRPACSSVAILTELTGLHKYLLTPWCRVLLEKLTGLQLVKKFPAFYGTRRFITALTSVRQLSLSWASPIQSIYPHSTSWRSILILSTHLCLGLPNGFLPSGFPTKTLYTPLSSPIRATCSAHLILLDFVTRTILGEE